WNPNKQNYVRKKNCGNVLKVLNNSQKMDSEFLNELKNVFRCSRNNNITYRGGIHQYFGITQHPETKNYIIIIELA
ncbi:5211_t:CDS:2, partial [Gigaspora margarita]